MELIPELARDLIILQITNYLADISPPKKEIQNWAKFTEGEKIILIYAIHTPFLKVAVEAKQKDNKIKICLIVPDLPEFMAHSSSLIRNTLQNLEGKLLEKLLPQIDSFVVLTRLMVEKHYCPVKVENYFYLL